jgi:hypothetical protein
VKGFFNFNSFAPWIVLIAVCFSSCRSEDKPEGKILSQPEMVEVLIDVYLAEQKLSRIGVSTDSATAVFAIMESRLFEKHGVADSVFKESLKYYKDHPKDLEKIYSALVDSLQLREQRAPHGSVQQ